jgi:hypothetical protein
MLVFSSALNVSDYAAQSSVVVSINCEFPEIGGVLPLGTSGGGFDGLGINCAAGWKLYVFDKGTHFD